MPPLWAAATSLGHGFAAAALGPWPASDVTPPYLEEGDADGGGGRPDLEEGERVVTTNLAQAVELRRPAVAGRAGLVPGQIWRRRAWCELGSRRSLASGSGEERVRREGAGQRGERRGAGSERVEREPRWERERGAAGRRRSEGGGKF